MMTSRMQKILLGIKNRSFSYQGFDENVINYLIEYTKQYLEVLVILGYIDNNNSEIIENIFLKVNFILPYKFYMHEKNNMILVDVNQYDDNSLTNIENIMLNTYQKVGEYILTNMHYHDIQLESLIICEGKTTDVHDIMNSFSLLIKALSQELAEQVLSYLTGKQRVTKTINLSMVLEKELETDFNINGSYQEPACLFSGILLEDNKKTAFYELSQICLTKDFIEFITNLQRENIYTLLRGLCYIKEVIENENNSNDNALTTMKMLEDNYNKVVKIRVLKNY